MARPQTESVTTHDLQPGDVLWHHGAELELLERREHPCGEFARDDEREIEARNGVCVTFTTRCLNDGGDIPAAWRNREGGFSIQGNRGARWARIVK